MKTIELDLERDNKFEKLRNLLRKQNIKLGKEQFSLTISSGLPINQTLYASFLLLLNKYFATIIEENKGSDLQTVYTDEAEKNFTLYFETFDVNKLERKIEKDFVVDIKLTEAGSLNDVFGIWSHDNITAEKLREKSWQRNR